MCLLILTVFQVSDVAHGPLVFVTQSLNKQKDNKHQEKIYHLYNVIHINTL